MSAINEPVIPSHQAALATKSEQELERMASGYRRALRLNGVGVWLCAAVMLSWMICLAFGLALGERVVPAWMMDFLLSPAPLAALLGMLFHVFAEILVGARAFALEPLAESAGNECIRMRQYIDAHSDCAAWHASVMAQHRQLRRFDLIRMEALIGLAKEREKQQEQERLREENALACRALHGIGPGLMSGSAQ